MGDKQVSVDEDVNKELAFTILKFSAKFINELDKKGTSISSPLSAEFILALLTLSSSTCNPAHVELLSALGFPNDDKIRSSFETLMSNFNSIKGITLNIANKIYIKEGLELETQIKKDAISIFDTDIEAVNFSDGSIVTHINEWVESKTNNKINNVANEGTANSATKMLLINAIYFKGNWRKPFNASLTKDLPFHLNSKQSISVPMMTHKLNAVYRYGLSNLQAELLLIPYAEEDASMVIVLPTTVDGVDAVLTKLAEGYDLITEIDRLTENTVDITIPKFKVETTVDMTHVLHKLGVKSMFYSGLDKMLKNNEAIPVSKAIQKAFIEVNEEGTEASAVTYVPTVFDSPPHFNANRPFVYLIVGPSNIILFIGVYRGDKNAPKIRIGKSRWDFLRKIFRRK